MAYLSSQVALNVCEAEKFALACLAGTAYRAHSAACADLAQRAKVSHCPCCTLATHVALPPKSAPGDSNSLRARGSALRGRMDRGPPNVSLHVRMRVLSVFCEKRGIRLRSRRFCLPRVPFFVRTLPRVHRVRMNLTPFLLPSHLLECRRGETNLTLALTLAI